MSMSISGGKKVTSVSDAVTVTVGATATIDSRVYSDAIGIEFTGTECHVIQIFIRKKIVRGRTSTQSYGRDAGGLNLLEFTDDKSPDWQVDTTSAAVPYYDFRYAGAMTGTNFLMVDAPKMSGAKYDLPGANDVTTFDAFAFCISDKDMIAIVKWDLVKNHAGVVTPSASLLDGQDWWDCLNLARTVLTRKGYNAELYLAAACIN
jgi:hypothetical protein